MSVCPLVWVSSSLGGMIHELPPGYLALLEQGHQSSSIQKCLGGARHTKALSSMQEVGRAGGKPHSPCVPSCSAAWPGPEGRHCCLQVSEWPPGDPRPPG